MQIFTDYFKALKSDNISDITEQSHRRELHNLLEAIASQSNKKIKILHEPKRKVEYGSPDFKITKTESIIGYVENKKIEEDLDKILKSEQIKRYIELSDNILLTNYIEWIWIRKGEPIQREQLCFLTDIENKRSKLDDTKAEAVYTLIKNFFSQPPLGIAKAKELAKVLAIRAKWLKEFLFDELKRQSKEHTEGKLFGLFSTFRQDINAELNLNEFSDAYSLTLIYGLFLAKLQADTKTIDLYNAKSFIPASFELIKELLDFIDELYKDEYKEIKWIVEEVLSVMNNINLIALQQTLSFKNRQSRLFKELKDVVLKDPYVYFYEDFLSAYDAKLRKSKGVYYTPPPVVNFIIRAIDEILIDKFKISDGLADRKKVTVLDFAAGTGTFLLEIFEQVLDKLPNDTGKRELIIKEHFLKNIYGFEYLIGPYTVAHLKLSQFLSDNDHKLIDKERINVFLTNTLEPLTPKYSEFIPALYEEGKSAKEVKDKRILVITGNPPYSGHSTNPSNKIVPENIINKKGITKTINKTIKTWIGKLIEDYKEVDGKPLGEKNPKWLQDDYVKFIRFAQYKMSEIEEGIVGIISNHAFLDNPTFRGMRQSLMNTFNQMYFLNLHGNTKRKEQTLEGTKDENVFDIEQGVSLSFLIKKKGLPQKIFYSEYFGLRDQKYYNCLNDSLVSIKWKEIIPNKPFYLFLPQKEKHRKHYEKFCSIKDIFDISSIGIVSARDGLCIHNSIEEVYGVITKFVGMSDEESREYYKLGKDTRDWKVENAKKDLINSGLNKECIRAISYRPFDVRYTYYTGKSTGFLCMPRGEVMNNVIRENNLTLNTSRNLQRQGSFSDVLISNNLVDAHFCTGISYVYPLYQYNDIKNSGLFDKIDIVDSQKKENLALDFRNYIDDKYEYKFETEKVLGYIYTILHSPTYRKKYAEFLAIDFPRIPFAESKKIFDKLSKLGWDLIQSHLMKREFLDSRLRGNDFKGLGEYTGTGDNYVVKPEYIKDKKTNHWKVQINPAQYFDNIPEDVYNFYIGGYQVLIKYLKDRKGRILTLDEIENVENIVKVLRFTIDQMKEIDKWTKEWI